MKILNLSLDEKILDADSSTAVRILEYGDLVDAYFELVPSIKDIAKNLSDKVKLYGVAGGCRAIKFFRIYNLAKKIIKDNKIDLITVQDPYYLGLVGVSLAAATGAALEIQIHGLEKYSGLRKAMAKFVVARTDGLRTVSQRMKKRIMEEFGVKDERITSIPIFSPASQPNGPTSIAYSRTKFIFLTIGRLVSIKNIGLQIEALALISKKYSDVELWIVGEGPEEKKLKAQSEKLKVDDKVKFFGWQEDLKKYYSQAHAFLLTSDYEGWGLVVIEAAAASLPIIMTNVGCAEEIIVNNESGIIVPIGDVAALADGMSKLIDNRAGGWKLGAGAKQAIAKLPDKTATLAMYLTGWEKAIAHNANRITHNT